jgi:hypothetical protein
MQRGLLYYTARRRGAAHGEGEGECSWVQQSAPECILADCGRGRLTVGTSRSRQDRALAVMGTPLAQEPTASPSLIRQPPCETTKPDRYSLLWAALKPRRLFCANRCISLPVAASDRRWLPLTAALDPSVALVHRSHGVLSHRCSVRRGRCCPCLCLCLGPSLHPLFRRVGSCVPRLDGVASRNFPHPHGHSLTPSCALL